MYESFSQDVKNEICSSRVKNKCCRASFLKGMIFGTGSDDQGIFLESENPAVVIHYGRLVKEFTDCRRESEIALTAITEPKLLEALRKGLGVRDLNESVSDGSECEECARSFIRGAFLSCGTVTYPENSYHMEFLLKGEWRAERLSELLTGIGLAPKTIERRTDYFGVYFKDSENVVDLLGHLGANKAAFKMMEVKIVKDVRNNLNRVMNCEMANMSKTAAAFETQMRAITKIVESGRADELPEELKMTLDLRAAFPEATLKELAEMHTPPITKSGVNHRLKRIMLFSEKL